MPARAEIRVRISLPYIPIDISSEYPEKRIHAKPATILMVKRVVANNIDFTFVVPLNRF